MAISTAGIWISGRGTRCMERDAINTDSRQIRTLLRQADGAITQAVSEGDMTAEDAGTLVALLQQSRTSLAAASLTQAVPNLNQACAMFN
jgi:hypothetical protein